MDHIVYLDSAKELQMLVSGEKTMIARASLGKKRPYGKVAEGDMLFFANVSSPCKVKAMAKVKSAYNSDKMAEEEAGRIIEENKDKLKPTADQAKRLAGKRYVVLIEVEDVRGIVPFSIADNVHGGLDDWLVMENIDKVIC